MVNVPDGPTKPLPKPSKLAVVAGIAATEALPGPGVLLSTSRGSCGPTCGCLRCSCGAIPAWLTSLSVRSGGEGSCLMSETHWAPGGGVPGAVEAAASRG